jgi:type IV secretion system protein VirB8
MFKRSQQAVTDGSKHWYQDKYQHVLSQRNLLALIALIALATAAASVLVVLNLAPKKSVEPYLIQVDEKTGITQRLDNKTVGAYQAAESVDRYFTAQYIRLRESYNVSILRYNYEIVRLMSTKDIFRIYAALMNPNTEGGIAKRLGANGQRDVRIRSMAYIVNPTQPNQADQNLPTRILQARIVTSERMPNSGEVDELWVVTVTFQYSNLNLNADEQLQNPLGYTVVSYQIHRESD